MIVLIEVFVFGILGFYVRRLYANQDRNTEEIKTVKKDLADHRVEDARDFLSRKEFDARMFELKNDIRGMISPLHTKMDTIDNYVREQTKTKP